MSGTRFAFHEVDQSRWDDLVRLFETRGGPKTCWCMVRREKPAAAKRTAGQDRKAALKAALHSRVAGGIPIGILGYDGDAPVAWCSIAPRSTYRPLGGLDDPVGDPEAVWSLVCFFVKCERRGQKLTDQLLAAGIE